MENGMGTHIFKMVETTIQYLQFIGSIFLVILSATGAALYYYWTNKLNNLKEKDFWPFAIPAAIVLGAFIFIGHIYGKLINDLAGGSISSYVQFWFEWVGTVLWVPLFAAVLSLVFAFIKLYRRNP